MSGNTKSYQTSIYKIALPPPFIYAGPHDVVIPTFQNTQIVCGHLKLILRGLKYTPGCFKIQDQIEC